MSKMQDLVGDSAAEQGRVFVRRMREAGMIPVVVLGFGVEQVAGMFCIRVGSLWADRLEESSSAAERVELEELLGRLSKLIGRWIAHDRERMD